MVVCQQVNTWQGAIIQAVRGLPPFIPDHGRNKSSLLAKIAMQTRQRLVGSTIPAPVPDQSYLYNLNNLR